MNNSKTITIDDSLVEVTILWVFFFWLLREFLITYFKLCFFGYPFISFLITCYWLFKVRVFVISSISFCSVGGFLVVLNCVFIDLSYVLYERLLMFLFRDHLGM